MKNILVFGAGAVGRGYIPWLFDERTHVIDCVDININLIRDLSSSRSFTSFMTDTDGYKGKEVSIRKMYHIDVITSELIDDYDYVLTAIGPRQFMTLSELFKNSKTPIVCFENDRNLVGLMRRATSRSDIYFGIPDVIASSSSSKELEMCHKNCLITEQGVTFVEAGAENLDGDITYASEEEISSQWAAKLYIHNTPHCIAAYLGSLKGKEFLHEAMSCPDIYRIVESVATEMAEMVQKEFGLSADFSKFYLEKELSRFSNPLLFDPIARIAREPFRKLALNDRLIGAATRAISNNVNIPSTLLGVIAAFSYDDQNDSDRNIEILFKSLTPSDFLGIAIGLNSHEVIYQLLLKQWDQSVRILQEIRNNG